MDFVIVNNNLYFIDYLKNKEFLIKKNRGSFLAHFNHPEVAHKLGAYNLIAKYVIGHPYSVVYSNRHFVDYRDTKSVGSLEKQIAVSELLAVYEERQTDADVSYYFLNPILYKRKLGWLDKIGAILYFTCGVKCHALWFKTKHIKKFIPSNGARYPFKAKIIVPHKLELKSGIYNYAMRSHGLVLVKDQANSGGDVVEIIYYADVSRVMKRYPNGIAYRDLLFDFGHLCATVRQCLAYYQLEVVGFDELPEADLGFSDQAVRCGEDAQRLMYLPFLRLIIKPCRQNQPI